MTIEMDRFELCSCGTNDDLVLVGLAPMYRWPDGKMPFVVECWGDAHEQQPQFLIDDEGRDQLFGAEWRDGDDE